MVVVGEGLDPFVDFFGAEITCTEDGGDFVGGDHVFVLDGYFGASLGDVEVSEDQRQLSHLLFFSHV